MILRLDKNTYVNLARVTQIRCDVSNRAVFVFGPEHVLSSSLSWEKATEVLDTLIEREPPSRT